MHLMPQRVTTSQVVFADRNNMFLLLNSPHPTVGSLLSPSSPLTCGGVLSPALRARPRALLPLVGVSGGSCCRGDSITAASCTGPVLPWLLLSA